MRYSVDAICKYYSFWGDKDMSKFVVIQRLSDPCGLAFPGGGIEKGEDKEQAIMREVKEETGLSFCHHRDSWLPKVYDTPGRDPRFPATSYVAHGIATGKPKGEEGKTEVLFLSKEEILSRKDEFVFDHYEIFCDYLSR